MCAGVARVTHRLARVTHRLARVTHRLARVAARDMVGVRWIRLGLENGIWLGLGG